MHKGKHSTRADLSRWFAALTAISVCLCLVTPARAADKMAASAKEIGLSQAIKQALDYSPNLKKVLEQVVEASEGKKAAFTYFLPSLDTGYLYRRNQDTPIIHTSLGEFQTGTKDYYQWSTSLTQPVFTGFRLSSQYELSKLGVDTAKVNVDLAILDLVLKVKENYYNYLTAQKGLTVALESVKLLESQLKTSRDFHEVGIIPINDVLKTEVELANAQQNLVKAENLVQQTRASLNILLGRPVQTPLQVEDILRYDAMSLEYPEAKNRARAERPELKAVDLQIKQADQGIRAAQSDFYPQVNVQGTYNFASDSPELGDSYYYDTTDWQVVAQLQWNLFSWGRTKAETNQQRAVKRQAIYAKRDLEDQVDLQVKQALLYLREAEKNIFTAQTSIRQAKENYRITNERFQAQLTTNTELLDAQTLLTQARVNYYRALNTYNVAKAALLRAMGGGVPPDLETAQAPTDKKVMKK